MARRIQDVLAGLDAIYQLATLRERLRAQTLENEQIEIEKALLENGGSDASEERPADTDEGRHPPIKT